MLPKTQNSPTLLFELLPKLDVSFFVGINLILPELSILAWHAAVIWTAMPKTAVNEYCDSVGSENDIGPPTIPFDRRAVDAEPQSRFVKSRSKS
jgi:hypothetical protein